MTPEAVRALGDRLQLISVLCVWFAVLVRAPSAYQSPRHRGLWLALATAGAAMTLSLTPVRDAVPRLSGIEDAVALTANLFGVLSVVAILDFVGVATGGARARGNRGGNVGGEAGDRSGRRVRVVLLGSASAVVGVLVLCDLTVPPHTGHGIPPHGPPVPSLTYWLLLIATHTIADVLCVWVCYTHSRRHDDRSIATSLRLFGLGTAFAVVYWTGFLLYLPTRSAWILSVQPIVMALHGVLRAAAVLIPTVLAVRRESREAAVFWQLWPLWRDLVRAVPHIALSAPRPRLLELIWPRGSWALLAYRKIIEIRDAFLVLRDCFPPQLLQSARHYAKASRVPARDVEATVVACLLRRVLREARVPRPPSSLDVSVTATGGEVLADDTDFLLCVARAYCGMLPKGFCESVKIPV